MEEYNIFFFIISFLIGMSLLTNFNLINNDTPIVPNYIHYLIA